MLLVLRLFAVYGAAAALALYLAVRFVRAIRLRTAVLLAAAPLLLVGKAFVTAGVYAPLDITYDVQPLAPHRERLGIGPARTPVLVDVVQSYIPWRKAVRESIENGRLPLWNRFTLAGEPLLAVQEPAALHPFTWIGLLLPLPHSWTLEMALRLLLALLCAYLFFRELECGELPALVGAAGWALSDFLIFHLGFPLSPAAAPLPLLLLGLTRLARSPGRGAVALTVVALLLVVLAGHPETLLHVVAAAGLWFLFELGREGLGRRGRPLLLSLLAGAFALGLSAIVLLPFLEILPHTREHGIRSLVHAKSDRSVPIGSGARLAVQNAMPYAFGVSGRGAAVPGFELPSGYAGALVIPLALAGLGSRRREKWVFLLLAALGAALHARLPVVADAVASLPLFELALNERMAFLTAFGSVALGVLGAERLARGEGRRAFSIGAAATAVAVALLFVQRLPRFEELAMPRDYAISRLALQVVPLLSAAGFVWFFGGKRVAVAGVVVLFAAARAAEAAAVYPTHRAEAFYPRLPIVEKIPRGLPWRTAPIGYVFVPNMPAMYELEDVRGYVSLTLAPLAETFPLWCVPRPVEWNRVADPTTPFLSFLNVRYVLAPSAYRTVPPGWKIVAEGPEGRLLENPGALPRAFAPRALRYEKDPARQVELLRAIRDFAGEGIVEDATPTGTVAALPNGPADVRITRYVGGNLSLEIDASGAAVVGTSIPRWPGWTLTVNGREEPLVGFNRAFLAFRVPHGRHRAELAYRPKGFIRGAAMTGVTLATGILVLAFSRRREIP